MKQDFIIYTRMLEVALWAFEKANTFPKKQRFVLGQQIQNSTLNSLRLIIEANNAREPGATLLKLQELNVELEVLRSLFRIAYELKFIKATSLGFIIGKIDEVGKMAGSWAKKSRKPGKVPLVTAKS